MITAIDILSLGRPPSWRRAEPIPIPPHGSIHFVTFFENFSHPDRKSLKMNGGISKEIHGTVDFLNKLQGMRG